MKLFDRFARRAANRKAYAQLLQLDDHLLRDMGITRSDVLQMMAGHRTAHTVGIRTHE
ncbi:MAG: DUF1127 domain-containing protein [Devosia sp.]